MNERAASAVKERMSERAKASQSVKLSLFHSFALSIFVLCLLVLALLRFYWLA